MGVGLGHVDIGHYKTHLCQLVLGQKYLRLVRHTGIYVFHVVRAFDKIDLEANEIPDVFVCGIPANGHHGQEIYEWLSTSPIV